MPSPRSALAQKLQCLSTVFSAHGGEKLARLQELAINTRENKRAIDCFCVGVLPSVKTTRIPPSGFFIFTRYTSTLLLCRCTSQEETAPTFHYRNEEGKSCSEIQNTVVLKSLSSRLFVPSLFIMPLTSKCLIHTKTVLACIDNLINTVHNTDICCALLEYIN